MLKDASTPLTLADTMNRMISMLNLKTTKTSLNMQKIDLKKALISDKVTKTSTYSGLFGYFLHRESVDEIIHPVIPGQGWVLERVLVSSHIQAHLQKYSPVAFITLIHI